jgi:FtsP/CotA-like multicopper oxidase with cupredoxin domain
MKKILCFASLLMLGALAFGQTNLPPCDPNNPPPNCTDYFGVANWANSPLPAGAITGFTIVAAGSGYSTPVVTITDTAGFGATAGAVTLTAGAVTAVAPGAGGSGYIAPQVTIVDMGPSWTSGPPTCGAAPLPACGSGALVAAVIGGTVTGGIRKFMATETLPLPLANLSLAVPDTTTFPGSDYYVIALQEYAPKMHADLPATKLRGYVQLNNGTAPDGTNTLAPPPISYLGPTILAFKNRPVRVLFKNMLPIGAGGNLFIPVDTTYMGAGAPYTQNRATLHLHGGATPWISDGTPHQWTVPAGETGPGVPQRGDSVQFVPDMYFDSLGNVVPFCTATVTTSCYPTALPAGAKNDPGQGNLTFFWTNQQGGRLMFYHDHAYGLTRLNVYAGEAAGYLLVDPTEETALLNATVPGTIATNATQTAPDLAHFVPLVIQDKTFVPSAAQLAAEDPTWTAGGFGTTPGTANPGDLWFPHVYVPNQNPADVGGANAFGRWDYGPWTLPGNQTVLLAATPTVGDVTIPCTSSAFPNQAVNCPITPNPSGTPESFMDTPLVNGKAYPVLHVAPAAYRFRILSAGNDRSLNLQLYVADPTVTTADGRTNTEVKMVPAVQPAAGALVPLCTAITPITNTSLFMGLATGLLDATGNPINGTGLPAGCWPNFGAGTQAAGIPVQQTMWAADGRAGGAPDPTTAGPPFIQIGTEGGLLPAPVVIPSMPIGYEANTRSVTITNVSVHGLWLGPAERADAIVDFSKFAGKTLILYNDAPTPAPAIDSRTDYFTGDGDQTVIGGAPNTLPGFGPNTRTIMQIVVDSTQTAPNTTPFSLASLQAALPAIFAQTQPVPIVPEPTYPPASGAYSATPTYSLITDATLTFYPIGSTTSVTYTDERKAIQELFTLDYGRMNATLGTELPLTNFLTQTTIPLGYIDPPTEIIKDGETQLWHITHNGVDTHFIHFHLFNVQVINRSAWDGTKRPPDQNELGWKDTVRMNPLEDILVALKPIQPVPPFPLRDSYRLMDVTMPVGSDCPAITLPGTATPGPCSIFTDVDPFTNIGTQTPNKVVNFGWEYVWHCHILGHEENDMMRAIAFNVPPEAPSNLTVASTVLPVTGLNLSWTDNSASETGFTLERAADAGFTTGVVDTVVPPVSPDANGQGITWGSTLTSNDAGAIAGPYFYRVRAFKPDANYWIASPNITSAWSNTATVGATAGISPAALAFGTVPVGTPSAPQTVTLSNTGTAPFAYATSIVPAGEFAVTASTCGATVLANSTCAISVTFTPTASGPWSASLSITTTDPANPTLTVSLTGAGGSSPLLTITASNATMKYGAAVPIITPSYNPPNPVGLTTLPTCTTTATTNSGVGQYQSTCSGAVGPYTITYVAGTVSVTPVPLTIWANNNSMLAGSTVPVITASYVGFVNGDTALSLTTPPTCTTTATNVSPVGKYPSSCSGAVDPNYTISYVNGTVTVAVGLLAITAPNITMPYGGPVPTLTPTYSINPPAAPFTPPVCTTSATIRTAVGTYPGGVSCSGAVDPNYTISYIAGTVTVTAVPLVITAPSPTMPYGGPIPPLTPTYAGFVAGETAANLTTQPTCVTTATVTSPVSPPTYTVTCSGAVDANYSISYVQPGTLTITRRPASVTPNPVTKVYGNPDPALTGSLVGFLAADNVTASYTRTAGTNVGTYTISATLSSVPPAALANYNITYNTAAFTITKATASVTPNAVTKVWGFPDPPLTGLLTGFVSADGVTATYTRTAGTAVGTYTISATLAPAAVLGNYNITYNTATFTISTAVQLAPLSLTFATQNVGTTSPIQIVTLRNTGGATLTGIAVSFVGLNPADFVRSGGGGSCGTTLAVGATCNINVRFRPTATGLRTANLSVTAAGFNSGTVTLTGTGNGAVAGVSPASHNFGGVLRGTPSAPFPFTVTNSGNTPLTFNAGNGFTLGGANPGQFQLTTGGSCANGGTVAAGGSCSFNVIFAPTANTARNTKNATVTINSNATNGAQSVTVSGLAQ